MGNTQSLSSVKFVRNLNDQNFGQIQIYQQKENSAQFIMKYSDVILEKQLVQQRYEFKQRLQQLKHKALSKLYFVEVKQVKFCIITFSIDSYLSFYNITLQKIFTKRVQSESAFPENQLWYILKSLIELGQYLQNQGLALQNYSMRRVFISPGGFLKVYLNELKLDHQHSNLTKYYLQHNSFEGILLAPEQINILKGEMDIYDIYKSDVFSIGVMMLQLMTLDQGLFYSEKQIDMSRLNYSINDMRQGIYSSHLLNFVSTLIQQNPSRRPDFKSSLKSIQSIISTNNIEFTKSIGADISNKRKSQGTTLSSITFTDFSNRLIPVAINSFAVKRRRQKKHNERSSNEQQN